MKIMLVQADCFKKQFDLQCKVLDGKIKDVLMKESMRSLRWSLRHKSKLYVFDELKREVGFVEHLVLFSDVHHMIPKNELFELLKKVLPPDIFVAFLCGNIFNKTVFLFRREIR